MYASIYDAIQYDFEVVPRCSIVFKLFETSRRDGPSHEADSVRTRGVRVLYEIEESQAGVWVGGTSTD